MRKAFLYDNQGYVTNPFKVRNNTSYAYKWQKTHSRCERLCSEGIFNPLKNVAFPAQLQNKPATAPDKIERVKEFEDSLIKLGPLSPKVFAEDNDSFLQLPQRYSNFRTTVCNRKPLLFLKPYMRHRNQSLTLEQNKAEVYKEIKDSRLDSFREPNIIEYMTEYCERSDLPRQHSEAGLTTGHHKQIKSINVLREKLKSKCGQSQYRNRIRSMKLGQLVN